MRRAFSGEAGAESLVQRQHLVVLRLLPPQGLHRRQAFGLGLREVGVFGEVARSRR
jgi:hypothetical protein